MNAGWLPAKSGMEWQEGRKCRPLRAELVPSQVFPLSTPTPSRIRGPCGTSAHGHRAQSLHQEPVSQGDTRSSVCDVPHRPCNMSAHSTRTCPCTVHSDPSRGDLQVGPSRPVSVSHLPREIFSPESAGSRKTSRARAEMSTQGISRLRP